MDWFPYNRVRRNKISKWGLRWKLWFRSTRSSNNGSFVFKHPNIITEQRLPHKERIWEDNQPFLQALRLKLDQRKSQKSWIDFRIGLYFCLIPCTTFVPDYISISVSLSLCLLIVHIPDLNWSILPLTTAEKPKSHQIINPASQSILLWAQAHIAPLIRLWSIIN